MKRILSILLLALLGASPAFAEVWQARYGVAETFNFKLYNADGTLDVDEADGGTEVSLSCNEGAETTATNDFVDEGTFYSIALTSGEMQCERVAVVVAATTTEVFFIQTHSNASAMTPLFEANAAQVGGQTASASGTVTFPNATLASTTNITAGTVTTATNVTTVNGIAANAITATAVANGAIDAATFASGAIDATAIAADAIGASELASDAIGAAEIAAAAIDLATFASDVDTLFGIARRGTAQSATATTLVLDSGASFADDTAIGMTLIACGSTQGYCQSRLVTDYVLSTDTATVATWTVTPSGTITFYLIGSAPGTSGGGGGDATEAKQDTIIAYLDTEIAAILADTNEVQISLAAGGLIESMVDDLQTEVDGIQADTEDLQTRVPATLVGGRIDATVDGTGMEAGAVTAIQSGLATSSALSTLQTSVNDVPTNSELNSALAALASAGVYSLGYKNAAGDSCTLVISETTPNLTPSCTEAP
jgi:hypothetical protein